MPDKPGPNPNILHRLRNKRTFSSKLSSPSAPLSKNKFKQATLESYIERKSVLLTEQHEIFPKNSRSVYCIEPSPCGKYIASAHNPHCVIISEIASGKVLKKYDQLTRSPWTLSWHKKFPNFVATACLNGTVCVFNHGCRNAGGVRGVPPGEDLGKIDN